jgi:hypothetical protein
MLMRFEEWLRSPFYGQTLAALSVPSEDLSNELRNTAYAAANASADILRNRVVRYDSCLGLQINSKA